jgi:Uma2 family endonuclease
MPLPSPLAGQTVAVAASSPPPLASPDLYRMTVDEYERIGGMLDDDRIELINGYLVKKMGKKPPHIWAMDCLLPAFTTLLPLDFFCRKEDPVRIPEFDEPEPDISVVRGPREAYRGRIPEPKDLALLVEVAETTLERDRGPKLSAYAKVDIPVYWIVNLVDTQVEVYSNPAPDGYRTLQVLKPGQDVPVLIDGREVGQIAVADILP